MKPVPATADHQRRRWKLARRKQKGDSHDTYDDGDSSTKGQFALAMNDGLGSVVQI